MKVDKEFNQALKQGACDVVDTILQTGYIPHPNSIVGPCTRGNLDIVTRLLKYPINVQRGLSATVKNGHIDLLNHLYLAGADINFVDPNVTGHAKDDKGNTLLHDIEDVSICKWLLDMGARQVTNGYGETPLLRTLRYASCRSHGDTLELIKLFLDNGADHSPDENGTTPLIAACKQYSLPIVDFLILRGATQVHDNKCNYPLHYACTLEYVSGYSNLRSMNIKSRIQIVECLLRNGTNINSQNSQGLTSLHMVCGANGSDGTSIEMVRLLLNWEAVQVPDDRGNYPLHYACQSGVAWMIASLLINHTRAFPINACGETSLHIASRCNPECFQILLHHLFPKSSSVSKAGFYSNPYSNLSLKTINDITSKRVREQFSKNVSNILGKNLRNMLGINLDENIATDSLDDSLEANLNESIPKDILNESIALADLKAEILNMADCRGRTALHEACSSNFYLVVEALLKVGAVQIPNNSGDTPLHLACRNDNYEIVKLLLQYGGQQIPNNDGHTPWYVSKHFSPARQHSGYYVASLLTPVSSNQI